MTTLNLSKTERVDIRVSPTVKQLLQQAASSCHKSVSEFLLDAGLQAADQALADRRYFALSDTQWREFQQALDAPAKKRPRLEKLLTEPGLLD